jgi:CDP-glucose 4,6-dehydratase
VETYATNVLGTINVLEALRELQHSCVGVMVTTDKCYANREWVHGYREEDALGGYDPYSSSKAAAEIAIASWRRSFFMNHPVRIASARAGNVIGGADWATDRLVPDCVRSLQNEQAIPVRNRFSTRPWQHVLEPLSGYLWLAAVLANQSFRPFGREVLESAFNFGPAIESNRTVAELVQEILKHWPGSWEDKSDPNAVHEASLLNLSTDKAYHLLAWKPVWSFEKAVQATIGWYRTVSGSSEVRASEITSAQIVEYQNNAAALGLLWAGPRAELASPGPVTPTRCS